MMKLILYNGWHNGDVYFSQAIVKVIRKYNPELDIIVINECYNYLYKDVENIIVEDNLSKYNLNKTSECIIKNDDFIAINLWIAAITQDWMPIQICSKRVYESFREVFRNKLNLSFQLNLPDINAKEMLPITPKTDISRFLEWKNTTTNKLIFYNDVIPMSGQPTSTQDHMFVVSKLCNTLQNYTIITRSKYCDNNNLSLFEDLGYVKTTDGETLCKITNIYPYCDLAVTFDVGTSFNFIEDIVLKSNVRIIHFAVNDYFYNNLSLNVAETDLEELFKKKTKFICAHSKEKVVHEILRTCIF